MDVTGFTDAEDEELDLARHLLFSLEQALIQNGANFKRSNQNWSPNVVEDGAYQLALIRTHAPILACRWR